MTWKPSWVQLALLLLNLSVCCGPGVAPVEAQAGPIIWTAPLNISNTPASSGHPAIITDDYGYVHVFWSEEVGGGPVRSRDGSALSTGNSIYYTRWDGVSWTSPLDILFVPAEAIAAGVAVALDAANRLHLVWTGQSNFYYSNALSQQAVSAHAWSTPLIVANNSARSAQESDIVAAGDGNLHIVYATRGAAAGIYHICSQDEGQSWKMETKLSRSFDHLENSLSKVQLITDGADRLHVVWQTNQEQGYGQAIYYTRSVDGGETWEAPGQFEYRDPTDTFVGWPYITAMGDSEIHLIYVNGSNVGRAHRVSTDGGETWGAAQDILTTMEGINGYIVPLVDATGQRHLLVNMRTRAEQKVGIYYTRWLGDNLLPVKPLDDFSPAASSAHYTAAAVRLGNELHVVYTHLGGAEIWYLRGTVLSVAPLVSLSPPLTGTEEIISETLSLPTPGMEPSSPTREVFADIAPPPPNTINRGFLIGVGTTSLLLASVVTAIWVFTLRKQ
ncbi:MAG: glycoside hydrolase [Anaerolineae bacterium]|nr:glycoside hydrolase [Anaerolineae bacterium]